MMSRNCGVPLRGIALVGAVKLVGVDGVFGRAHTTSRLEPGDTHVQLGIDEPVTRGHRRAVVEERSVANDDWLARGTANDNLEGGARRPTEQLRERSDVLGGGRHAAESMKGRYGAVVVLEDAPGVDGAGAGMIVYAFSPGRT